MVVAEETGFRMTLKDKAAIVGIGATPYYRRGESLPLTETELACQSILGALDDAGLTIKDLDGFALYSASVDPAELGSLLGIPEIRFAATLTSGGGGSRRLARAWPRRPSTRGRPSAWCRS